MTQNHSTQKDEDLVFTRARQVQPFFPIKHRILYGDSTRLGTLESVWILEVIRYSRGFDDKYWGVFADAYLGLWCLCLQGYARCSHCSGCKRSGSDRYSTTCLCSFVTSKRDVKTSKTEARTNLKDSRKIHVSYRIESHCGTEMYLKNTQVCWKYLHLTTLIDWAPRNKWVSFDTSVLRIPTHKGVLTSGVKLACICVHDYTRDLFCAILLDWL